jgi:pyridoxine 5-phosphate synthase
MAKTVIKLGVNVDHTATLRRARGTDYPDPVVAAMICEYAGCASIVAHLREDRRHIQERDAILIRDNIKIPFNLEMAANKEIAAFALKMRPAQATLVPEKRKELTTEGGLDLGKYYKKIEGTVKKLQDKGVIVRLFVDADKRSIESAKKIGCDLIEINTGRFSEAKTTREINRELSRIKEAAQLARSLGFAVAAGHGINYANVRDIVKMPEIEELNIGHAIISRAVYVGLVCAVEEMIGLMNNRK